MTKLTTERQTKRRWRITYIVLLKQWLVKCFGWEDTLHSFSKDSKTYTDTWYTYTYIYIYIYICIYEVYKGLLNVLYKVAVLKSGIPYSGKLLEF